MLVELELGRGLRNGCSLLKANTSRESVTYLVTLHEKLKFILEAEKGTKIFSFPFAKGEARRKRKIVGEEKYILTIKKIL